MQKKFVAILLVMAVAAMATTASAAPILTASHVVLPSGNIQWTVFFDGNDGAALSSAFDLEFQGNIVHQTAFGALTVDDFLNAQNFDGLGFPPYDKTEDTWIAAAAGTIWTVALPSTFAANNGGAGGITHLPAGPSVVGTHSYGSFGTAGGATQGPGATSVAQIVIDSTLSPNGILNVGGFLARGGASVTPVSYTFLIPEPSSALLMLAGVVGFGMAWRRRK